MNAFRALAVLLLVSFPAAGFAAGEAEHAAGGGGLDFLWKVINFAVLFGALFYFLRKPLQAMLDKKAETVRDLLADARREREEAEAKLTEAATRVAELQDEAARLKERAAAEARAETERIRNIAAREAERIRTLAAQEVAVRLQAGIRELKEYTTGLAAGLAEDRLKKRLTEADHIDLIDRSIDRLKMISDESAAH